jgi:hypothetical protein
MPISSLWRCDLVLEYKATLLQSRTSEKEARVGAEKDDTGVLATVMVAGVVKEDTREDHVRETATRTDDTDLDERTTIATADMALQKMERSAGNITVVASAQGQGLGNAGDSEVARRGIGETEKGTATDAGVMTERQDRHSDTIMKKQGHK